MKNLSRFNKHLGRYWAPFNLVVMVFLFVVVLIGLSLMVWPF
jgi:hypothetical protein